MTAKDALARIFEQDTLASPDELIAALDAAGYVIVAKEPMMATSEIDHSPCREELLRAEIERLQSYIRVLIDKDAAADEIERLRAFLNGITEETDLDGAHTMARRALEGK
jgi:hypothetical protein